MKPLTALTPSMLLATGIILGFTPVVDAVTIVSTDFNGRTVSGNTAANITYTTNGVADPGDLSADFPLFDTAANQNLFAVSRNLHTGGPWVVNIPIAVGSQNIQLDQISLDAYIFTGSGGQQVFSRDFDMTIELLDNTQTNVLDTDSVVDLFPNSNTIPNPAPVPFVFDFSGNTILANTTYFLRLTASGQGSDGIVGVNGGFDNFLLTGDLVTNATTPEPSTILGLIGVGLLGVATRKRK